ncbi:general odorant-binding protein 99a-like [Eupeodes corollae]|uniref:general odorant-binding protein 99a-like n=1 Tax=Eupeodes corollae TaxID=290404 RepID=UPI00248FA605|nr:general odorant-binding protein 99a-like [Eupeodes corollae]
MKIFIILALIVLASAEWKPKSRQELKQARLDCIKSLNIPQDLLEKANRLEYPDTDLVKEFVLCGARTSELWNESEGWLSDRIMRLLENDKKLNKEEAREVIESCLDDNSQGSSLQDWSYRNFKCLIDSRLRSSMKKLLQKLD